VRPHHSLPFVLLVAFLVSCGDGASGAQTTVPALQTTVPLSGGTAAAVLKVFDGDTLLVLADGAEEEVRLLGINAPERDECYAEPAAAALARLTASGRVAIDTSAGRDGYGRLLGYVYVDGALANLTLITEGAAIATHTEHEMLDEFLAAEEAAFAASSGLWAAEACGPATIAGIEIVAVAANPAGPDEVDLDGEYVTLSFMGAAADLSGWTLRDESSQHRYRFPQGTQLGPRLRVHTGCGADTTTDLYWCADGPVWNNAGDSILLLDPSGNVADRLRYSG